MTRMELVAEINRKKNDIKIHRDLMEDAQYAVLALENELHAMDSKPQPEVKDQDWYETQERLSER